MCGEISGMVSSSLLRLDNYTSCHCHIDPKLNMLTQ